MTQTNSSAGGGDSTVDKKRTTDTTSESTNDGAGNSSSISSISSSSSNSISSGNNSVSIISTSSNTSSNTSGAGDVIAGSIITTTTNNKDSNNRINLKQAKISDRDHEALDKSTASETSSATTTTTLSKELNSYAMVGMHENFQDILESDLSCAICQDIYINPLILNCSHSFCKFCVFRWLSKKTDCPQCRMTVQFQAENLALRNIINRMVQKASPQFQTHRTNSVNQRLKDEEAQEKDGTNKAVLKNASSSGARHNRPHQNQERNERTERLRINMDPFIRRVFPSGAPSMELEVLEDNWSSGSESPDDDEEGFDLYIYANATNDADTTNSNDEENDVTFEMSSDDTSSSEDDEDDNEDAEMESGESDGSDEEWDDEEMLNENWDEIGLDREEGEGDEDENVSADEDNINVDDDDTIDFLASSSSSDDEDGDDTEIVSSPGVSVLNFSLPDTDSDPGTASDDSTEEDSSVSYLSGRYSRQSSIEFGTDDDEDDDDENENDDDDSY